MKNTAYRIFVSIVLFSWMNGNSILAQTTRNVPSQYSTIQAAIDAAVNGDTVLVSDGVYSGEISFKKKLIKMISKNGAEKTIIEPTELNRWKGVTIDAGGNEVLIKGFTITKFNQYGIYCDGSSPRIENNIIKNNTDAGIWSGGFPVIKSNVFTNDPINPQQHTGIVGEATLISRNLIIKQTYNGIGTNSAQIVNNTIADNFYEGIVASGSTIKNNIIVGNSIGIKNTGPSGSNLGISYNNVWNSRSSDYFNCTPGTGNISAAPVFVNQSAGDFHLQGTSPCIDAGDPASPLDPDGTRADMGAFYFRQGANETFTDILTVFPGLLFSSVAWGDYDNDGDLDILLTGFTGSDYISRIYRNDGGTFVNIAAPITQVLRGAAVWGDYDNDGDLDILLTGDAAKGGLPQSPVSLVYRNERGSFVDIGASIIGVYISSVAWGDYDNDGDLDILLTGFTGSNYISKIYRNDSGIFVDIADPILAGVHRGSVAWGDYDNDGDLDILLAGEIPSGKITKIYRNDGGKFIDISAPLMGVFWGSVVWGDYDSDGDLDILLTGIIASNDTPVPISKVYRNNGGTFVDISAPLKGIYLSSGVFGDYDNDGDLDILLVGSDSNGNQSSKIYRNDGGSFVDIAAPLLGASEGSATWGDYDNDRDLDILITGDGFAVGYVTKIFRNNIGTINTVPTAPTNLNLSITGNAITLSWNKSTDKETAQNGLTYNLRVGTTPGGSEIVSPMADVATGYRKVPQLGNTNHNTRWTIKNLAPGKYYWSVQAIDNAFAGSSFAPEQSFTIGGPVDTTPPAPPKNLQATPGDKQITLKWDANTELDLLRYRIYGGAAPNPAAIVDSALAALGATKIITGLSNGTTYYYRITAVDVALNASGFSNEASAVPTGSDMPPAPPRNLLAIIGDKQITLGWTANAELDMYQYRIYSGTSPNPLSVVDSVIYANKDGSYSTSKTISGLTNGTKYYFRITAVDLNFNESGFSNEVSATPAVPVSPPATPQNLRATAGIAQVTLTWNANTEADFLRYRIYGGASANPTAQIDSAEGRATNSKTINNLAIGATYYFRLKAVNTAMQASGYSNIVAAVPLADKTAPTLANAAYTEPANLNGEVAVAIAATDASGIKNVWLYYRVGGSATFSNRLMARQNGDTYTQTIPAPAITNKGAEFYVAAEDAYGNMAQSRLHPVRVYCPAGIANPNSQPSGKEASFYRLFSIPLALDDKSPAAFLTANSSLGEYDKAKYRWYGLERSPQALREYPNFGNIQMTPDMGFALLVNIRNVKLKTGSGTTANTTAPYNIALPAGWSLVGNPFHFNIPFDSLRISKGSFELWRFEGDWQLNTAGLEPWKGYAIWLSQAATFSIRPGVAGLKSATAFYSVENNATENWLIQISADNGRSVSRFNFVGQNELANDHEDQFDLHQPMNLAGGVEVVLTKKNSASLKADIRRPSANGHTWEFTCRLNPEDEVLSLTFDGVATVPPAFGIFLIEPETATAYDLRTNPRLQFATHNLTERRFQLVAGTKAYLHEQNLTAGLQPVSFALLQNFPNPFNPATQIIYSLPEAGHVEVSVYNIRGEAVATLVNERQASGSHTVVWNAEQAGSGVYFIKMRAGRVEMMKKCLLVK